MAYDEQTLVTCHLLTELGKKHYQEILELKADDILLRHEHPLKYLFLQLCYLYEDLRYVFR